MTVQTKALYCQISKVDEEKRTVTGIGTSEALDGEGEIFDYPSSKPYVQAWSDGVYTRSQGKSYGNIREMHQLSAVGKLSEPIIFDDTQKLVILTSYISDDQAWKKCFDGTYTGFSISGPVIGDKWSDAGTPGAKRYTCAPVEFSICDAPCNPDAFFTAVKAGGATEQRKFKAATAAEKEPNVATAQKSMYNIGDLASIISSLRWTQEDLVWERESEGDGSPVPDKLKAAITSLCEVLVDLAREESAELVGAMKTSQVIKAMKTAGAKKMKTAAKAGTKGLQAVTNCMKALDSAGGCVDGSCDHEGIHKCAKAVADAHKKASDAMSYFGDPADDGDGDEVPGDKTPAKAASAPQSQGASPENGDTDMDEVQKAALAKAQTDAAESLRIATETNAAVKAQGESTTAAIKALGESFAKGLETVFKTVGSEPVAAKSFGPGATGTTVTKEGENGGTAAVVDPKDPHSIAKSILSKPQVVSGRELNIGR
jgi:hypothetical protein